MQEIAARNYESTEELEKVLVGIFNDGDSDGNGYLDPAEFMKLLETADLGLDASDKRQLLVLADANGDGKIEYAEFAPLGADIIHMMRIRQLHQEEQNVTSEAYELRARQTLHGMGEVRISERL